MCQAAGEPLPTITWLFNSVTIDIANSSKYNISNSFNETVITSLLAIMNTQSTDVGTYSCHSNNVIGRKQSSGILTINST